MSFTGFMFAFMLALLTFYVNQRIAKMTNIKILINTLFDIYGGEAAMKTRHKDTDNFLSMV
jgi:hypothetical protein